MSSSSTMSDILPHRIQARVEHYANHRSTSPLVKQRLDSKDLTGMGAHMPASREPYPEVVELTDDESASSLLPVTPKHLRTSFGSNSEEGGSSYEGSPLTRRTTPMGNGPYLPEPYCKEFMRQRLRDQILMNSEDEDLPTEQPRSVVTTMDGESQHNGVPEYPHPAFSWVSPDETLPHRSELRYSGVVGLQNLNEDSRSSRSWSAYNLSLRQPDLEQHQQYSTNTSWALRTYLSPDAVGGEEDPFVTTTLHGL